MIETKKYRILVIAVFFVLLFGGMYIGYKTSSKGNKNLNENTEPVVNNKDNENEVNVYEPVSTKKYDVKIIYQDYYTLCGETITSEETKYDITLDDLKTKVIDVAKEKGYEVIEQSNDEVTLRKTQNRNCPNHFEVKYENGSIVIYELVDESVKTEYKKLDITADHIRAELLEELNEGIRVNSKEELNLLIEDLES